MDRPLILPLARTPLARFGGALKRMPAPALAARVVEAACHARVPSAFHLGMAFPHGAGPAPAREALRGTGIDCPAFLHVAGWASGLDALGAAAAGLDAEGCRTALVAGADSTSSVPYLLPDARWGRRVGGSRSLDPILLDGPGPLEVQEGLIPLPGPEPVPGRQGRLVQDEVQPGPMDDSARALGLPPLGDGAAALLLTLDPAPEALGRLLAHAVGTGPDAAAQATARCLALAPGPAPEQTLAPPLPFGPHPLVPGALGLLLVQGMLGLLSPGARGLILLPSGPGQASALLLERLP